jgi:hypothetical protein
VEGDAVGEEEGRKGKEDRRRENEIGRFSSRSVIYKDRISG